MNNLDLCYTKILVIIALLGLTAGCVSVTDATLPESAANAGIEQVNENGLPGPIKMGGNDVEPIIERPELGRFNKNDSNSSNKKDNKDNGNGKGKGLTG